MPIDILGIHNDLHFEYFDKFCTIVLIFSVPVIIDVIYFTHFMNYLFFNYKTLIIIANYFVFYFTSTYFVKMFNQNNVSGIVTYFCSINIKIFSFLYKISRDLMYFNMIDPSNLFFYYIITGLQFICIFNILASLFIFNKYFDKTPGKYINESDSICSICFESGNNWKLPCGHDFHKECICKWFKSKSNCPLCRTEFN